jgi:hypothetical protein
MAIPPRECSEVSSDEPTHIRKVNNKPITEPKNELMNQATKRSWLYTLRIMNLSARTITLRKSALRKLQANPDIARNLNF